VHTESLGQRLRRERLRLNWSQERLAQALETTSMSINRWEHDKVKPQPHYREQLCHVFSTTADALFGTPDELESQTNRVDSIWNVPIRRNLFFTGREAVLRRLYSTLCSGRTAALTQVQAVSGLGGIGKTQTAVEYAYRYRNDYQAILWVRAETHEVLLADLVSLAEVLGLPERDEPNQNRIVQAVKHWLNEYSNWLLILDNVGDLSVLEDVLPSEARGHLLLTTRAQSTGNFAQCLDLEQMEPEEGALFLLRRAKLLGLDAPLEQAPQGLAAIAKGLTQIMGGLPLALDQAGAYIEETGCSLSDYQERYQAQKARLLNRRGNLVVDHPESVSTTLSLSFQKVEHVNSAAAELLRLCAFLAADAIPEEIITEGASELGSILQPVASDPLALDDALAALRSYSLLRRNAESKTLTIHRLVQAVLKERMNEEVQRQWAERTVRAVNRAFPAVDEANTWVTEEITTWASCQRCLPHAYLCTALIGQWKMVFEEAGNLLHQIGSYLWERGQYVQAEVQLGNAYDLLIHTLGPEHPKVANSLESIASLYYYQGKYLEAQQLFQRALAIREKTQGPEHLDVASCLEYVATIYHYQGKDTQVEPLFRRVQAIREKILGAEHPEVAACLNNAARVYGFESKYVLAEVLHQQARAIWEKALGPECPEVATSLVNLAELYHYQGKDTQAESLYLRALAIEEKSLGYEHPTIAVTLGYLAKFYHKKGKYMQSLSLLERALMIREKVFGSEHPRTAQTLNDLAVLYSEQSRYKEAELLFQRALDIRKQMLRPGHPDTIATAENYADLLRKMKWGAEAEPILDAFTAAASDE